MKTNEVFKINADIPGINSDSRIGTQQKHQKSHLYPL